MQRFTAILFLFLVSSPVLIKTGILGWYFWNKAAIVAKYCINKARPDLHCDGKCYLAAKLKKADHSDEKLPASPTPAKEDKRLEFAPVFVLDHHALYLRRPAENGTVKAGFPDARIPAQLFSPPVFKPPA